MKTITIQFTQLVKWDNWGRYVTVFKEGDIVQATQHDDGYINAESPYWPGISDGIDPSTFIILKEHHT